MSIEHATESEWLYFTGFLEFACRWLTYLNKAAFVHVAAITSCFTFDRHNKFCVPRYYQLRAYMINLGLLLLQQHCTMTCKLFNMLHLARTIP